MDYMKSTFVDITGYRFNRLKVIGRLPGVTKHGSYRWQCVCDCGKERVTTSSCLKTGSVKSCGCTKRESTQSRIKDMLGKRLGRLVVVERLDKNAPGGSVLWRCKCNCGKEHISSGTLLRS